MQSIAAMRGIVLTLLLLTNACSFAFVRGAPRNAVPTDDCTEVRLAPAVDTGMTLALGALAIGAMASSSPCTSDDCLGHDLAQGMTHAAGAALLIPTLIYAVSAAVSPA